MALRLSPRQLLAIAALMLVLWQSVDGPTIMDVAVALLAICFLI